MNTDTNIWNDNYPIRFYHVKDSKSICPSLLCDFMQDSAVNHIEALGHSLEMLQEQKHGWVLSKMFLKLDRLPEWKEKVKIKTWQPGIEKLYALRDFILSNDSGDEIGRATSFWLAVDMDKKRLLRPQTYLQDNVFIKDYRAISKKPRKIPSVIKSDHQMCFTVHSNNLDLNGHTNSIIYLKWIFKVLKQIIGTEYNLSEIEVNYIGQSYPGDKIQLFSNTQSTDNKNEILTNHTLIKEENGDTICNVVIKHNNKRL